MLRVENLSKRYGAITVADNVAFEVAHGECLGIIGPNGAGKTSLLNLIDGSVPPDNGRVRIDGQDVTRIPQHRRVRLGLARAYQVPQAFANLSVYENVLVAALFGAGLRAGVAAGHAAGVVVRTGLAARADRLAGDLPLLDRKRLELARALATRPRLLLLDEIAGGLTDPEVGELVALLRALKQEVAMLWIEHVAHALLAVADRLLALDFGACIASGAPQAVMADARVRAVYLGVSPDVAAHG